MERSDSSENSQQPKVNICYEAACGEYDAAEPMLDAIDDDVTPFGRGKSNSGIKGGRKSGGY